MTGHGRRAGRITNTPETPPDLPQMPPTRYQGSKRKLLPWIWENIKDLDFQTVLDAFSGSGCVAYWLKACGKAVTCNDILTSNYLTGLALVENSRHRLRPDDVEQVLARRPDHAYDNFIERTFRGIYFLDTENRWLDTVCQNVPTLPGRYRQALAWYALFQSAVAKRPYNLFHRKNLYMRTANVRRSFGNKVTWDRSFEDHFRAFVAAANAAVLNTGVPCQALCQDILPPLKSEVSDPKSFPPPPLARIRTRRESVLAPDLVYIDPPYINARGVGVDYHGFYHFLEGMADYAAWPGRVDYRSKNRCLIAVPNPWTSRNEILAAFRRLFERFADSTLVVSYRGDGIPTIGRLASLLREFKSRVEVREFGRYKYALSTNKHSKEHLLVGTD